DLLPASGRSTGMEWMEAFDAAGRIQDPADTRHMERGTRIRMRSRLAPLIAVAGAGLLLAVPVQGQERITVQRIFEEGDFRLSGVAMDWMPDGDGFLTVEQGETRGGTDLWVENVRSGERVRLVAGTALASSDTAEAPSVEGVA